VAVVVVAAATAAAAEVAVATSRTAGALCRAAGCPPRLS